MESPHYIIRVVVGGVLIAALLFGVSLLNEGPRDVSALESIYGIDYPLVDGRVQVYESLAHADLQLVEPVFGKTADVTISFIPHDVARLSLGVRRNSFWLSYDMIPVYDRAGAQETDTVMTRKLAIPLTDKLQDADRSLDIMLFASAERPVDLATLIDQPTFWELTQLDISARNVTPNPLSTMSYLASIFSRERAL